MFEILEERGNRDDYTVNLKQNYKIVTETLLNK